MKHRDLRGEWISIPLSESGISFSDTIFQVSIKYIGCPLEQRVYLTKQECLDDYSENCGKYTGDIRCSIREYNIIGMSLDLQEFCCEEIEENLIRLKNF
jgi:hypothetical protein